MRNDTSPNSSLQSPVSNLDIAILHYSVPPIIGGVEATIGAHARLLRAHGHSVRLLAGRGEQAELIPEIDSQHPRVREAQARLNEGQVTPEFLALVRDLTSALELALDRTDVVMAHNVATLHKNLALTCALHELTKTRRIKTLAWCHDFAWTDPVYANDMHDGMPWELMRTVWNNTRYIVVSQARQQELARLLHLPASEIAVVPPGIDAVEFFQMSARGARWAQELRLLEAAPLLLLPARVTRRKNIELAIDIVAALRENGHTPKLLVMGPLGPHNPANRTYLEELKARAAQNDRSEGDIIFLQEHGAVTDTERRDLYALADALLFPSAREGFGIPILEAGLARLPIFCADIPPLRETAGDSAHYFALDELPARIAARMAELLNRDARYRLKRRVLTEYAWEAVYHAHIAPLLPLA